mgnify:CR=1 FL=1
MPPKNKETTMTTTIDTADLLAIDTSTADMDVLEALVPFSRIRALRAEAAEADDQNMVDECTNALRGKTASFRRVCAAIKSSAGQA